MGINEVVQIGKRIKEYRKSKGFTQKEIALRAEIPYSTYSNYENNNREPNREQLQKIANALNVPLYELMGFDGSIRVNGRKQRPFDIAIQKFQNNEKLTYEEEDAITEYVESEQFKQEKEYIKQIAQKAYDYISYMHSHSFASSEEEFDKYHEQQQKEEAAKNAPKFTAYDEKGNKIKAEKAPKFTTASRSHAQTEAYDLFHSLLNEDWIMTQEQEVIAVQLRDILNTYNELNDTGRKMAVKRIEELRYSDIMTDSQQDDIYFDRIKKKIKNGEKLAPDEIEWWHNYLDKSVKTVGAIFESLFSMLNKEGQRKAHTQINRAIDQIEMLTKIPEYQKNPPEPSQE